jgi:hypothetical protein
VRASHRAGRAGDGARTKNKSKRRKSLGFGSVFCNDRKLLPNSLPRPNITAGRSRESLLMPMISEASARPFCVYQRTPPNRRPVAPHKRRGARPRVCLATKVVESAPLCVTKLPASVAAPACLPWPERPAHNAAARAGGRQ